MPACPRTWSGNRFIWLVQGPSGLGICNRVQRLSKILMLTIRIQYLHETPRPSILHCNSSLLDAMNTRSIWLTSLLRPFPPPPFGRKRRLKSLRIEARLMPRFFLPISNRPLARHSLMCIIHIMNSAKLVQVLKDAGFEVIRVKSSHHQLAKPGRPGVVTVPHPKKDW